VFNSPNSVIINYQRFAGGKFIINCLTLSKYTSLLDYDSLDHIIDNPDDYEYRFDLISTSLPEKNQMMNWVECYELGEPYLGFGNWWREGVNIQYEDKNLQKLLDSGLKFFMTSHNIYETKNLLNIWKNSELVYLINFEKFQNIAIGLKGGSLTDINGDDYCRTKYNILKGSDWPDWDVFENHIYAVDDLKNEYPSFIIDEMKEFYKMDKIKNKKNKFNIDNSIFDEESFIISMKKLYQDLGFDDFNEELISKFWKKYTHLHF